MASLVGSASPFSSVGFLAFCALNAPSRKKKKLQVGFWCVGGLQHWEGEGLRENGLAINFRLPSCFAGLRNIHGMGLKRFDGNLLQQIVEPKIKLGTLT